MMRRAAFLAGAAMMAMTAGAPGTAQMSAADSYAMTLKVKNDAIDLAYKQCLASTEQTRERSISLIGKLTSAIKSLFVGVSTTDKQRSVRGAIDAPSTVYLQANSNIRDCINRYLPAIEQKLLEESRVGAPGTASGGYPGAIDVRFTYRRNASLNAQRYSDNLRVNLREMGRQPVDANIASQSGQDGSPFFFYTYFPFPRGKVVGTIAAKPLDSRLTADQVPRSSICFERAAVPATPPPGADMFDCTEGGACKPVGETRRWLKQCAAPTASLLDRAKGWLATFSPIGVAHAQDGAATRWVTPSIDTLSTNPGESVGYSYFKIKTAAFKQPDIDAVEVGLAVNGVRVDEDGLAAAERPVPNDPAFDFTYLFALQTLNFEGREGGCDVVTLTLTPTYSDGRKGDPRNFRLSYGALRDQPERTEKSGNAALDWSATVIRPMREWRHIAFVHSYGFTYGNEASQKAALAQAVADKAWIDSQRWTINGDTVRGVIRPPLTLTNGKGYYGFAVGLVQPTGQVRFTFSETKARSIGAWMIGQRGTARARQIINAAPYLYQARSGGVTPAGICTAS